MPKTIQYDTDVPTAIKKLRNAMDRLQATDLDYNYTHSLKDSDAYVAFRYKGEGYRFEYSNSKAQYFGLNIPQAKDVFIALINGILDLTRVADRGIFDFGQVISSFKAIEFIDVPKWAEFMGFNTRPRNIGEVRSRYNDLAKGSMNPNSNRDDFEKLQKAYEMAKQYFGVS